MAENIIERIRRGAAVECTDGRLGTVESVEPDGSGAPMIILERAWSHEECAVPIELVREVGEDGTVWLSCTRADLERPSPTAEVPAEEPPAGEAAEFERTIELREEQLVAHKELRDEGVVHVRTEVEERPGRLEVDALSEQVEVEHEPVGRHVSERVAPWEEDGVLVVPVYEEQLVVTKRLLLREHLRIRRVATTDTQVYEDKLRRERLVIEAPDDSRLVHERLPAEGGEAEQEATDGDEHAEGGLLEKLGRKVFE